ncbi:MAG: immunoglobulin domain-containing protein, partial [Limisphaerales bacterium]
KKDGVPIPGATNQTLELNNVTLADMGSYSVVIQDDISSVESNPAQLIVLLTPIILQHPQSQIVYAGSTVVFDVVATGTPPLGYRWRRISTGIVTNIGISQLILTNVGAGHAQFYNVIVTNLVRPVGVISSNAYLVVITDWPKQDQTVAPGSTATFSVTVAKYTTLAVTYQWLKNGTPIPNATNATLTITNVLANDLGYYSVKIAAAGVDLTTPAVKLQLPAPQISQPGFANGLLQFSITAPTNMNNYWLQSSTNLITWQDLMPLTITDPVTTVTLPITNQSPRLFLRVKAGTK